MGSASMRGLALKLLSVEAANQTAVGERIHEGVRVCEKLQIVVTRFAGSDGFASLLRRSLALARAEVPALQNVELKPDAFLEGCGQVVEAANGGPDGVVAIIAHLLGLLETFVGEPLTIRLVREAWPDVPL